MSAAFGPRVKPLRGLVQKRQPNSSCVLILATLWLAFKDLDSLSALPSQIFLPGLDQTNWGRDYADVAGRPRNFIL